jgi:hypothetical protein
MSVLPDKEQQIVQMHAALIVEVVKASQNQDLKARLEPALKAAADNGWSQLVSGVRQILNGQRDLTVFHNMDDEDKVITEAILRGIQDPHSLPDPMLPQDPSMAAPSLAAMIDAAAKGDAQARYMAAEMAEQMSQSEGDLALLASVMRPMIDGETDAEFLSEGMSEMGQDLIVKILEEIKKLNAH